MFFLYKKYAKTAFDIGILVLTVYLVMFFFSYIYRIATPIFFGYIIFLMIEPVAAFMQRKGLKKNIATTIATLLFVATIIGILVLIGIIFTSQIHHLTTSLPKYVSFFKEQFAANVTVIEERMEALPPDVIEKAREYTTSALEKVSSLVSTLFLGLFAQITTISTGLVNVFLGIFLAYFLSLEIDKWKQIAEEKTPKTLKTAYRFLKENVLSGIVQYLKAQLKLISITFILIFMGLMILGVDNVFSIALLSALFDILPLLGTPVIFVPWIIYLVVVGNIALGIKLAVLLVVTMVIRQLVEPRIVGNSLGVSAFTMLSFMIISLSLFGMAGVILSPILLILIKALMDHGYLKKWIRLPQDEFGADVLEKK